jgi:hypothetical protein
MIIRAESYWSGLRSCRRRLNVDDSDTDVLHESPVIERPRIYSILKESLSTPFPEASGSLALGLDSRLQSSKDGDHDHGMTPGIEI